jgi:Ca2+-binding RTX toxin-like protein
VDEFEFFWRDFNGIREEYSFSTAILNSSTARITFTNLDSGAVSVKTISNVENFGFENTDYTFAELSSRVQSNTLPTTLFSAPSTSGADRASLGLGANNYSGLDGNDTVFAQGGNDTISGNIGNDWLYGQNGNDFIMSGQGDDISYGGVGEDTVQGGMGSDYVFGESGNDVLRGGQGIDALSGGDGNDTLYGGKGRDNFSGGAGVDHFVFDANTNEVLTSGLVFQGKIIADRITDFQVGIDKIVLASGLYSTSNILTGSGNSYISATFANAFIQVSGVTNLSASDFIFE